MKDQLFMLAPGFYVADSGPFYCPEALTIEGLLGFFPRLRQLLDVRYLPYARPRQPLVEMLGEANQATPVLVLSVDTVLECRTLEPELANGRAFFTQPELICRYLCTQYRLPQPS